MAAVAEQERTVGGSASKPVCDVVRGEVAKIRYREAGSGFVVVELRGAGIVVGEDPEEQLKPGGWFAFAGRWDDAGRYGRRFRFDLAMLDVPAQENAVIAYLVDHAKGVGMARAQKLWDAYGPGAVAALRTDPAAAAEACGLDVEDARLAALHLDQIAGDEDAKFELYRMFSGHGFPRKLAARVVRLFGKGGPDIVRRNPFILSEKFRVPLKRADRLWVDLGHPPDSIKRQAAWAVNGAFSLDGSTWTSRESSEGSVLRNCGKDGEGIAPEKAIRLAVRAGRLAEATIKGEPQVAPGAWAAAEKRLAAGILALSAGPSMWPTPADDWGLSEHQAGELAKAVAKPVGLLLGSAGTGKTYTTARLIAALIAKHGQDHVAVCAPTGKAAVRITEAMRQNGVTGVGDELFAATTIHRLLGFRPQGDGFDDDECTHHRNNPVKQRFVVVDESSMVDTSLASRLVEALGRGSHLLWVGDPYQLPPVGHGAPLRDFRDAGLACGLLTEVRRNAGKIVEGCTRIKDGQAPQFSAKVDYETGENLRLVPAVTAAGSLEALTSLVERLRHKNRENPAEVHPVWDVQVLVAANARGELSRKPVNDLLQKLLNGDAATMPGNPFRVGDKIICLKNNRYDAAEFTGACVTNAEDWSLTKVNESDQFGRPVAVRSKHYLANGEIGEVLAIANGTFVAKMPDPERMVKVFINHQSDDAEAQEQTGRGCNFDLAYAVTCHKMQGSEAPIAIVLIDESAGLICSREWHYTALSRARRLCVVVGKADVLERQIRRVVLRMRTTRLVSLLTGFDVDEI